MYGGERSIACTGSLTTYLKCKEISLSCLREGPMTARAVLTSLACTLKDIANHPSKSNDSVLSPPGADSDGGGGDAVDDRGGSE